MSRIVWLGKCHLPQKTKAIVAQQCSVDRKDARLPKREELSLTSELKKDGRWSKREEAAPLPRSAADRPLPKARAGGVSWQLRWNLIGSGAMVLVVAPRAFYCTKMCEKLKANYLFILWNLIEPGAMVLVVPTASSWPVGRAAEEEAGGAGPAHCPSVSQALTSSHCH